MAILSKKAQNTSLLALCLSGVFFIATLLLGAIYLSSKAVYGISWQILGGALVWLVLLLQFYQRSLAEREKLDMSRMAKDLQQDTIFAAGSDKAALFEQAQKRLVFFEKWVLPIASLVIAAYQIIIGLLVYRALGGIEKWQLNNPLLGAVLMILVSFVSFLISKYAVGMSVEAAWKPLRAGSSYLLATSILGCGLAIALGMAHFKNQAGLVVIEMVLPWLMVVLGVEILINVILDIYRPRVAGQYSRSAFDSRLLGMINEPGGLFHTLASTLDYQFGFQVSQTWFYKLLEKAILPLILFAVLTLYLLTCVTIIGPGQMAVIEHLGSPQPDAGGRVVGSGIYFKWPWPFDITYVHSTERIEKVNIGFVEKPEEEVKEKGDLLWGKEHFKEEYDLLVAYAGSGDAQSGVPVSLVRANIPVHYRIKDLQDYLYNHADTRKALESICYRELAYFAAGVTIETDASSSKSLLGVGRREASEILRQRIQDAADKAGLGIEIVLLGLQGIHPPPSVAEDYQNVVASVQTRQAAVLTAMAERNKILTQLAGSIEEVDALYALVVKYSQTKDKLDAASVQRMRGELTTALEAARGQVFTAIRTAQSEAYEKVSLAEATGRRFEGQLLAYKANPDIYKRIERLRAMEESLELVRKYVVAADSKDAQVYIIDLMENLTPNLYDMDMGSVIQK